MIRSSFNGFTSNRSTSKTYKYVSTPTCLACRGQTIGEHGEQCRTCKGAGFLTYKGGQGVGQTLGQRK